MSICFLLAVSIAVGSIAAAPDVYQHGDEWVYPTSAPLLMGTFPKGFIWSTATAAYQIEGGWNASGKGVNIWDTMVHKVPSPIAYNATGDVACDSFHKWGVDIQLMKAMGLKYYRFSISWARVLPNGLVSNVNPAGVMFYKNLIGNLTAAGIQPMVTLYHWDLPQHLQDMGGWLNDSSAQWFRDYANFCFSNFGPMIKYWITFNEPWVVSWLGYGVGVFAPQIYWCPDTCPYHVTHNIIKAHANAWHLYSNTYRASQKGQVGITLNCDWQEPGSSRPDDISAAQRQMQFMCGWFGHAIFSKIGDYPPIMKLIVATRSAAENRSQSRLPQFTQQEIKYIRGSSDFFGINIYTSNLVWNAAPNVQCASWGCDCQTYLNKSSTWKGSGSSWLKFTPWGARKLLNWIKNQYNNPPVIITENGWSDKNGSLSDSWRIHYYTWYINAVLKAIKLDKCNIKGYTAWSLLDNFEWTSGYTQKFGMHYVNFSDPARPRVAKNSAKWYAKIIKNNGFVPLSSTTTKPTYSPKPGYNLRVLLEYFDNSAGGGLLYSTAKHCDPFWFSGLDQCDITMKICVEPIQASSSITICSTRWLDLGPVSMNKNNATFVPGKSYGGWTNPMVFQFNQNWKGFQLKAIVQDVDSGGRQMIDQVLCQIPASGGSYMGVKACSHTRPNGYPTLLKLGYAVK